MTPIMSVVKFRARRDHNSQRGIRRKGGMRILLVEDDEAIAAVITNFLTSQHYVLDVAYDGQEGWELIEAYTYDLIVLDIMLPKIDGMTLCRQLRAQGYQMPVLLLTARHSSTDKVMGLDVGADDYVVKPFDLKELAARIRALLRRGSSALTPILEWEKLQLDPSTCDVRYDYQLLHLSPKEYSLLELFLRNNRRILSRRAILNHLWSWEDTPGEDTVKAHIKGLRQKLKSVGASPDLIETVYGMGYRLKPLSNEEQEKAIPQIIAAGVSEELAFWLQERLSVVSIQIPSSSEAILEELDRGNWSLLILDGSACDRNLAKVLEGAYSRLKQGQQSVIYCLEKHLDGYLPRKLVGQIFFHPLTWEELASAVAETLGLSLPPLQEIKDKSETKEPRKISAIANDSLQISVRAIWEQFKPKNFRRLQVIDQFVNDLIAGICRDELRQEATREAHKLAGSLGTFGFSEGSCIALKIEELLMTEAPLDNSSALLLSQWVAALYEELETSLSPSASELLPRNSSYL